MAIGSFETMAELVKIPPELEGARLPGHIAIIMDGNGRWAQQKGGRRLKGHEQGAESVRVVTRACARLGIGRLTLYAFSEENWRRPRFEVKALMRLLKRYLIEERQEIMQNNIRFTAIGRIEKLPGDVQRELEKTKRLSERNGGMVLCLALSYGGRAEIVDAVNAVLGAFREGGITETGVNEEVFRRYLYDGAAPDPDLLIRTAGEYRLSNFLLWQASYSELYVTEVLWPDFREAHLYTAIWDYTRRTRKFGALQG